MSGKRKFPSNCTLSDVLCQILSVSASDVDLEVIERHETKVREGLRDVMTNHGLLKGDEITLEHDFEHLILCADREELRQIFFHYNEEAASKMLERYRLWKNDEKWLSTLPLHQIIASRLHAAGLCVGENYGSFEEHEYTYRLIATDIRKFINEKSHAKKIKTRRNRRPARCACITLGD